MSYVAKFIVTIFRFLFKNAKFIPVSITGMYIVINFLVDIFRGDIVTAFVRIAQTVFAAEYTINKNVHLAIANSPDYGLLQFFEILISIYILYIFIRFLIKIYVHFGGAQAKWAVATLIVVFTVFPLEMAMIKIIDGVWGFVPIKDGLIFLLYNIGPVVSNIFGASAPAIVHNLTNISNSTNVTNILK